MKTFASLSLSFVLASCAGGVKTGGSSGASAASTSNAASANQQTIAQVADVQPPVTEDDDIEYRKPETYNVKIVIRDRNISDPDLDRRCFYKIYINKIEIGRTTIGLESQDKSFEQMVDANRHLLRVEKYVLDEKKGKYEKLNNIDQPKPDYFYFDAAPDRIADVIINHSSQSKAAEYVLDYEKE